MILGVRRFTMYAAAIMAIPSSTAQTTGVVTFARAFSAVTTAEPMLAFHGEVRGQQADAEEQQAESRHPGQCVRRERRIGDVRDRVGPSAREDGRLVTEGDGHGSAHDCQCVAQRSQVAAVYRSPGDHEQRERDQGDCREDEERD